MSTPSKSDVASKEYEYTGFPHLLENLEKWEYTWKTWKNHGILQKIIKIMEKLHGTWKNIWVDYKSLHARGRPQVLCVCLLSGGWNKCSILCMHWNGPRVNLNCQTCVHSAHLQRGKVGSSVWPEMSVRGLWGRVEGVSLSHLVCLHCSREATPWWLKETNRYPGPLKGKEPKVSLFIFFFIFGVYLWRHLLKSVVILVLKVCV